MKKWIPSILMSLMVLSSIHGNAESVQTGGMSGGGGGTLKGDQVEAEDIIEAIAESRIVIDAYLKGMETSLVLDNGRNLPLHYQNFAKMFRPGTDVFQFLGEVPFRIISNGACHNEAGAEVDASANIDISGAFVLVFLEIQPKVNFANYRAEIGALILHEIAHLYGSDETEAVAIQKIAVRVFAGKSPHDIMEWNYQVMQALKSAISMTEILSDALKSGAKIPCDNMSKLQSAYVAAFSDLSDGGSGMFLTRERNTEYYWQLSYRIMAMRDFLCTQEGYEYEPVRHVHVERFNKVWGSDTELTVSQYLSRVWNAEHTRYPLVSLKIKKYTSPSELPQDLDSTVNDLQALDDLLTQQWQMKFQL